MVTNPPLRRDLHFNIEGVDLKHWHQSGAMVGHFMNALSLFFPEGERFFIESVRNYRSRVSDPKLQREITGFIGQEAMHGREHDRYNTALMEAGLPARQLERLVTRHIVGFFRRFPKIVQLAITIGLEHFTAILADLLLTDDRFVAGDHRMVSLWRWHALEETEHKAVAFDVYREVMGRTLSGYLIRTFTFVFVFAGFMSWLLYFHLRLIAADKSARGWAQLRSLCSFLFGGFGFFRRIAIPWLSYFRPNFHPWDHDNHLLLSEFDTLVAKVERDTLTEAGAIA